MSEDGELYESIEEHEPIGDGAQFSSLYKYSSRDMAFSQEKKRRLFLQNQKEKRSESMDQKRNLDEFFAEEAMECAAISEPKTNPRKHKFSYRLMKSQWFTEIPENLADDWYIKLCPEGVRYLVVAADGITTCYLRNGRVCARFKSGLPGGNTHDALVHRFTILDCIYSKNVNVLFVYDVLAWNSLSLINAAADMRFFWLESKFEENPEMLEINAKQNFKFVLMHCFHAERTLLQDRLFTPFALNNIELSYEGVLFYHKEGQYIYGSSPLVGWLKTFMVPEILHIDVPEIHMKGKPEHYESVQQYVIGKKKWKKKQKMEVVDMEVLDPAEPLGAVIMQENMDKMVDALEVT